MKRTNSNRAIVGHALAISMVISFTPLKACLAIGLPLVTSSKKASLQASGYEKLTTGDGPATNDGLTKPVTGTHGQIDVDSASTQDQLKPMTLHDQDNSNQPAAAEANNDSANPDVLKTSVSTTDYVPKENDSKEMRSKSINGDSNSLVKKASKVGLGPVQLVESQDEANKKVDVILTAEQMELSDLWEATLAKSPKIQFVVQKLQPTTSQAHLSTILTRMLSTAAFGGMGAAMMMSPNMGMYAATSAGGSMIQSVLGMKDKADAKRAKLSQEEELVMFNIVEDVCQRMVDSYRDYKKNFTSLKRASNDLADLQAMVAEARSGQDACKQLEMEYTLRKQQRDIDSVAEDMRRHRSNLVDMAGAEAVEKLDKQIVDEQNKVNESTQMAVSTPDAAAAPVGDQPPASEEQQPTTAENSTAQSEEVPIDQSSNDKQSTDEKPEVRQKTASNPSPQS